ncbi:MAG TPA: ABC transporter permease [Solirubrobacter sp.]|nr:ABC transporter permease [Solirubrobacter sp.]
MTPVAHALARRREGRDVPLARRQLLHEPLKLALALAGVTLAVALVGLLFGLREGIRRQVTTFADNVGAEVYVAPRDARSFVTAGPPTLPAVLADEIASLPGVRSTGAIVSAEAIVRLHHQRVATQLLGFEPGRLGAPWQIADGSAPARVGEIAVDRAMARGHGLAAGDSLVVRGRRLRIVGLTDRTASWMTPLVFVTRAEAATMQEAPDAVNFVLVRGDGRDAGELVAQLRRLYPGLNVMTREELVANDRALMSRTFNAPLLVMVLIALAIGALVIAITTYGFVAERRREFGSLKAIGARNGRLYRVVSGQALAIAAVALVAGIALGQGAAWAIERLWPKFLFVSLPSHYAVVVVAALVMGLVGALVPARVLARLDPAEVFRR